jgi:Holliday junction resolvase RusA-like endonuclease
MPGVITIEGQLFSAKNHMQIVPNRSRKGGQRPYFLIKSKAARDAEQPLLKELLLKREEWRQMASGHSFPLALRLKIYRRTRARFDYVNCVQSLLDCMQKMKWIEDDDADHIIPFFDQYEVDSARPRVEISILGSGSDITISKEQFSFL